MRELDIETARVFLPALDATRDTAIHGGRGSGKSHFVAEHLIEDALAEPGNSGGEGLRTVCIREVQKDLAQSSKALIESKLRKFGLGEKDGFGVYKDVITAPGDGLFIFKGMNDYTADSIKSLEGFKRGWWEEAHNASKTSIGLYRPTMRASGSRMFWTWNPRKKTDAVDVLFRGPEKPTGAVVIQSSWRDNPWFTAELEQERLDCLRINPDQYDHIWDGGYVSLIEGAYFAKQLSKCKEDGRIGVVPIDPMLTIRLFADIGGTGAKADNFVFWAAQFVGLEIRVVDHYEAQGQPWDAHVAWLRKRGYTSDRAQIWLPHDGDTQDKVIDVSYRSAFEGAGYTVNVIPNQGKGAAMARVEKARELFPKVRFNEATTEAGRDALGWYHEKRDDIRGIGLGPDHDWSSHSADAYGLMCIVYEEPVTSAPLAYPKLSYA